jgi:putative ABC transport system substrate-binding protein
MAMTQNKSLKLTLEALFAAIWMVLAGVTPVFARLPHARIAVFTPGLNFTPVYEGLKEGLSRLRYKEGQNITFIVEDTKGSIENLSARVTKLLPTKPDVVFTIATIHTVTAKQATTTVPIVFAWVGDPAGDGLIASYASSKNNVTGVSSSSASLSGKRFEVLMEAAPKIKRVLAIVVPKESIALSSFRFLEESAKKIGVQLVRQDVTNKEEIEQCLQKMRGKSVDAIYYVPSVLLASNINLIVKKAKAERIPLVVNEDALVERGALISYGPDPRLIGLQAASLVDRVLKGTKPSEIVVETPNRLFLTINVTTANEIGLKIPRGILERADRLIE